MLSKTQLDKKKKNGVEYTPEELSDFLTTKVFTYIKKSNYKGSSLSVLDPACGEGQLLISCLNKDSLNFQKIILAGVDIDSESVKNALVKVSSLVRSNKKEATSQLCFESFNALLNLNKSG
jgi:type I restriction-modification system DNA methylase subunit